MVLHAFLFSPVKYVHTVPLCLQRVPSAPGPVVLSAAIESSIVDMSGRHLSASHGFRNQSYGKLIWAAKRWQRPGEWSIFRHKPTSKRMRLKVLAGLFAIVLKTNSGQYIMMRFHFTRIELAHDERRRLWWIRRTVMQSSLARAYQLLRASFWIACQKRALNETEQ